jgi:type I restriction enzyme S subunit
MNALRRFKPYPAYKDSGVEWLWEIPAHWEVKPIRALARPGYKTFTDGDWIESPFIRDEGIRLIQTGNVGIGEYKEQGFRYIDEQTFRAFRCTEVLPGDVLICRLADPVGRACLAPDLGCRTITSVDVCILKPASDVLAAFVVYALSGSEYLAWMSGICRGGTRDRVSRSMLGAIQVQKPPLPEQRAIAAFLDRETARIDALVAKKERLIDLLQEKRTALITRAVTKGLDPAVSMKDSGVEWLGEIPAHWEVKRVRDIAAALQTGPFGSQLHADEYIQDGHPVINPANLRDGTLVADHDCTVTDEVADRLGHHRVQEGDILFARRGELGRCGLVTRREAGWICGTGCLRLRPVGDKAKPRYLIRLMSTAGVAEWLGLQSVGATMQNLNTSIVGRIPIVLAPLDEQEDIAAFLDRETSKIDALIAKVREAIERLKELRTALISAAVTGKIDVREEVAA